MDGNLVPAGIPAVDGGEAETPGTDLLNRMANESGSRCILGGVPALAKNRISRRGSGETKYYVGFYDGDILVAIMDLIDGYPDSDTAFIGFFIMNRQLQGRQIGTSIIQELFL